MKRALLLAVAILGMAMAPNSWKGDSLTLKERIDQAGVVKVYFSNSAIVHQPNTNPPMGSQAKGTGCPKFAETTPLPAEFVDAAKQVIDLLNTGFNTTAFVAGDLSTVPLFATGIQTGDYDWLKHGEALTFLVSSWGTYDVKNMGLMGAVNNVNSLSVSSSLGVFGIVDGKAKALANNNLASLATPSIATKGCDNYDYFANNFPLSSLSEKFRTSVVSNTKEFTEKEMKKYEKATRKKI